jgi:hypothetical protein
MTTAMENAPLDPIIALDERWRERRNVWARKLGRLRLGVEPLDVQITRHRLTTWVMTAVAGTIGLMFVALFSAFRRPDVGLVLVAILMLPVIVFSWIGYWRLATQAREFVREFDAYQAERRRLVEAVNAGATDATPQST